MKLKKLRSPAVRTVLSGAVLALMLGACGGGGGDGTDPGSDPQTATMTGVLRDAPVSGVAYAAAPSGKTGTTNAAGQFDYEDGDTVSFTLNGLELGELTARAVVLPLDLANGDASKAANLLLLLQSLDSDPDEDIIAIALPASTDLAAIDLGQDPAAFAASAELSVAANAAGGTVVSLEDAKAHAESQFWKTVAGTYVIGNEPVFVRFTDTGAYLTGEVAEPGFPDEFTGHELGALSWDPTTGVFESTVTSDTNGDLGFSSFIAGEIALVDGKPVLSLTFDGEPEVDVVPLVRAANVAGSIVGVWVIEREGIALATNTFLFTADGRFLHADPIGDDEPITTEHPALCGGPGAEGGTYTYAGSIFTVTAVTADTNGCAGLNDPSDGDLAVFGFNLSADGQSIDVTENGEAAGVLRRLP